MYDETNVPGPEYRVRPVVRYVVTRYCHPFKDKDGLTINGHSGVIAEFPSEERAYEVAEALQKNEPNSRPAGD